MTALKDRKKVRAGETIKAGLAMQLKQKLGPGYIMAQHEKMAKTLDERLSSMTNLILTLGNKMNSRLATYSFVIKHPMTGTSPK